METKEKLDWEKYNLFMDKWTEDPGIRARIDQLEDKYQAAGQSLSCYLDGLLHADYARYWDYIHLETLLSIQHPRTSIPDEVIFIIYHQISELYFRLIIWEMEQLTALTNVTSEVFLLRIERINRYYEHMINSFTIMTDGIDKQQFLQFRTALAPASGFQSIQYRLIEIYATDFLNLTSARFKAQATGTETLDTLYGNVYWRQGGVERGTGKSDLSVLHFEKKYDLFLLKKAKEYQEKNVWQVFRRDIESAVDSTAVVEALRKFDSLANIGWPLAHYKSAVRHLVTGNKVTAATGGTNWAEYLPPRYQKVIFFPQLWSHQEREEWGKTWVMKEVACA